MGRSFDELIEEAEAAPADVWDFSWLEGRATEERPTWHYFDRVVERSAAVSSLLDLQAGTAQMIADLPALPERTVATEGHAPNVAVAAEHVRSRDAHLVCTQEERCGIPLRSNSFELITSRHPVLTPWDEVARVLEPGGTYLSQQVGPNSLGDLTELLTGSLPPERRAPQQLRKAAERAGLVVNDLRHERPRTVFRDIGAVVYFLRLVVWIVPDFTVERYRTQLRGLHDHIERHGPYEVTASRLLIVATKPR